VSRALSVYASVRKPAALEMQDVSRSFGLVLSGRDKGLLEKIQPLIDRDSFRDAFEDINKARDMVGATLTN
jgi:hypothetical protein